MAKNRTHVGESVGRNPGAAMLHDLVIEALRTDLASGLELDELTARQVPLVVRASMRLQDAYDALDECRMMGVQSGHAATTISATLKQVLAMRKQLEMLK